MGAGGYAPWIEKLLDDDPAIQRRAMARLLELMELPLETTGRYGDMLDSALARTQAEIAMHLTTLVAERKVAESSPETTAPTSPKLRSVG